MPIAEVAAYHAFSALLGCLLAAAVGRALLDRLGLKLPGQEPAAASWSGGSRSASSAGLRWFFWMASGWAVWNSVLFVLGLAGQLTASVVATVTALLAAASLVHLLRSRQLAARLEAGPARLGAPRVDSLELWGFACLLVALTWWCIRPPGMWDDTSYHLPYARHYLEGAGISMNPNLRFPLFPHHPQLMFAVGLMAGGEVHAQVLAGAVPVALTALGLFSLARHACGSWVGGALSLGVFVQFAPLGEALGYAYVDHLLMLWVWAALLCLWMASQAAGHVAQLPWVWLCALFAGTAASTKTFGGVCAFLVGLAVLLIPSLRWRAAWRYALAVSIVGGGWYMRSFLISGDPFHPLGGNLFGHFLWNAQDLAAQHQEQSTHGVSRSVMSLPQSLQAAGLAAFAVAFAVPLHPRLRRMPTVWAFLGIFVAYTLVWHTSTQVARYIGPVLPLAAFLAGLWAYGWSSRLEIGAAALLSGAGWARRVLPVGVAAALAWVPLHQWQPMNARLLSWDSWLAARSGVTVMREAASRIPAQGNVLLQLGFENALYFFPGKVIGDWFGPGRYGQMIECTDVCRPPPQDALFALAERHGAGMVAINTERFPARAADYAARFDVAYSGGGLLLVKRPGLVLPP